MKSVNVWADLMGAIREGKRSDLPQHVLFFRDLRRDAPLRSRNAR